MPEVLDIFNAQKWRNLIGDFDRKYSAFQQNLLYLNSVKGATPELEVKRLSLVNAAQPISKDVEKLKQSLATVRTWLSQIGGFFGFGSTQQTMEGLGLGPVIIGVGLAAAAIIVASITSWLKKADQFKAENQRMAALIQAGATPDEITKAFKPPFGGSSAKLFGFDVRWVLAIVAAGVALPWALKKFGGR